MATTMTQALATLRVRLREPAAAQWDDSELRMHIADTASDIARRTKCFEKSGTISITAATRTYTVPADLLIDGIKTAYFNPTGQTQQYPIEYVDIKSLDHHWLMNQAIDTGIPRTMTIWGVIPTASIILYPVPSVAGTLTIYYYRQATNPWGPTYASGSDSSNIDIPEGWIDLVFDGAEYRALRSARDPRWEQAKSLYEESLNQLMGDTASHSREPQYITPYRSPLPPWMTGMSGGPGFGW